jgi:hypothetical protein
MHVCVRSSSLLSCFASVEEKMYPVPQKGIALCGWQSVNRSSTLWDALEQASER